jgi:hypothetical protein
VNRGWFGSSRRSGLQLLAWAVAAYIASISVVYSAAIGLRLSFCVAVSSSPPRDHSAGSIV